MHGACAQLRLISRRCLPREQLSVTGIQPQQDKVRKLVATSIVTRY